MCTHIYYLKCTCRQYNMRMVASIPEKKRLVFLFYEKTSPFICTMPTASVLTTPQRRITDWQKRNRFHIEKKGRKLRTVTLSKHKYTRENSFFGEDNKNDDRKENCSLQTVYLLVYILLLYTVYAEWYHHHHYRLTWYWKWCFSTVP